MPGKVELSSQPRLLRGNVLGFNISPKGHIEGALVETSGGPEQINFPKHAANARFRSLRIGSKIDLNVELEAEAGSHCVYRVCDGDAEASGEIVRLNYALHGDVNGYHLDDATFLHVKPDGAKKYNLHVGDHVRATGVRREGPDAMVLEVRTMERVERLGKRHDDAVSARDREPDGHA